MNDSMRKVMDNLNPPIALQNGLSSEQFLEYLADVTLEDANESTEQELRNYLKEDFKRFCYTISLLPDITYEKNLLEIGGNPYYLTALMKKFTKFNIVCTNCFKDDDDSYYESQQTMVHKHGGGGGAPHSLDQFEY